MSEASESKQDVYASIYRNTQYSKALYPPIEPYNTGRLVVDNQDGVKHDLYYEECGNPNGPVGLWLHGGPGGGSDPMYRQFFDPSFYRIIVYDQRGSGKSTPNATLVNNNTWTLVDDIEKLRTHLNVDTWHVVVGGSWGSTLALAYAETYPSMLKSIVLRGVFLFDDSSVNWLFEKGGASELHPDAFESYEEFIPEEERKGGLIEAYYRRLTGDDEKVKVEAAKRFIGWELNISKLYTCQKSIAKTLESPEALMPFARLEVVFMKHRGWLKPNQLLDDIHKISHLPCSIIHGRRDIVCRPAAAWAVHKAIPNSTIVFPPDAGHSCSEVGIIHGIVDALDSFKTAVPSS